MAPVPERLPAAVGGGSTLQFLFHFDGNRGGGGGWMDGGWTGEEVEGARLGGEENRDFGLKTLFPLLSLALGQRGETTL